MAAGGDTAQVCSSIQDNITQTKLLAVIEVRAKIRENPRKPPQGPPNVDCVTRSQRSAGAPELGTPVVR
eukprot:1194945-Prorocentrum_minimum.AAC.6